MRGRTSMRRALVAGVVAAGCSDGGMGGATVGTNPTSTTSEASTNSPTTTTGATTTTEPTTSTSTSTSTSEPTTGETTEALTSSTTSVTESTSTGGPSCAAPHMLCGDECVDTQTDALHCGSCEHPCPAGELCDGGQCVLECSDGLSVCGLSCVDTQSDAQHCGGCDQPCGVCQACSGGQCGPQPPLPTPGPITGELKGCANKLGMYSVPPVPGAQWYDWTLPPGTTFWDAGIMATTTVKFGTTNGQICVVAGNSCTMSQPTCIDVTMAGAPGSQTFTYTGEIQPFIVPECITTLTVELWGAQGGPARCCDDTINDTGGKGGHVKADYPVEPGDPMYVSVGGQGKMDGPAGWNGGGTGGLWAAGGGGASDLRHGDIFPEVRVLVAGGGGGTSCGCNGKAEGGFGGGLAGGNGDGGGGGFQQGIGGQANGGGPAGTPPGQNGMFFAGGGSVGNPYHVAGGGGGWYGGGGAYGAGAGGGSSYWFAPAINPSTTPGVRTGDGEVKISW